MGGFPFATTELDLPEGATLALYTDGLIEARGRDIDAGMAALRDQLRRARGTMEAAADRILANLIPSTPADDTVLLLAQVSRAPGR
ncbi:SpoIIE family protein phosphatase [Streptomyces sp. NPDC059193]|uniref:SpoIIE family protein phosphatase n=1 Tax=Streptomyces sp. NPDC059193 TaxID=3346763 RepID=UPI00369FC3AE